MYGSKTLYKVLLILRPVWHILIVAVVFWGSYVWRSYTDLIPYIQLRIPYIDIIELRQFVIVAAVLYVLVYAIYGRYDLQQSLSTYQSQLGSFAIWFVLINFVSYYAQGFVWASTISRFVIIVGSISCLWVIYIWDWIYARILSYIYSDTIDILIIYTPERSQNISDISQNIQNFVENANTHTMLYQDGLSIDTDIDIVILVGDIDQDHLQSLVDHTNISGKQFFHINNGLMLDDQIYRVERVGSMLGIFYDPSAISQWSQVLKRLIDLSISIVALCILSPIMLVVAILIKIYDPGPIIYRHQRVGRNGVVFDYYKFRSMYLQQCTGEYFGNIQSEDYRKKLQNSDLNERKGELQKIKDDPRVTPIGRRIRKYSLDELPSLWCVVKGDMSIVGPRPHLAFEVARYKPRMHRLLVVKPGITCYSQIFGRDRVQFADEAKLDIYYIQNWSMRFDIYIILATLKVVNKGR